MKTLCNGWFTDRRVHPLAAPLGCRFLCGGADALEHYRTCPVLLDVFRALGFEVSDYIWTFDPGTPDAERAALAHLLYHMVRLSGRPFSKDYAIQWGRDAVLEHRLTSCSRANALQPAPE